MPVVPELQNLLDLVNAAPLDLDTLTPERFRAVFGAVTGGDPGAAVGEVTDRVIDAGHPVPVRVYRPVGDEPAPVLVWFHGGGWVVGNLDTTDATARRLCQRARVVVVSVDYRLAPEHPYPAGLEDAWTALTWAADRAADLGGQPDRLAVGGDSAGGNLAALIALRARDAGGPHLRQQLLVAACLDLTLEHPSHVENGEGYFLTGPILRWFGDHYLGPHREHGDPTSPAVSPLRAEDLSGVAPAQVLTAEFDPLRDEGDAYAARLAAAGVPVHHVCYPGLIHTFMSFAGLSPACDATVTDAAARLSAALRA